MARAGSPTDGSVAVGPRLWVAAVAGGIGLIVMGVILLVWPGVTGKVLALLAGFGMLWFGMLEMIGALFDRPARGWGLHLLRGLAGVVAGAIVLAWPHQTVLVVAVLLGLFLFVEGCVGLVMSLLRPPTHRTAAVIASVVAIIAGAVVVADPSRSLDVVSKLLGAVLVFVGAIEALGGFLLRDRTADASL